MAITGHKTMSVFMRHDTVDEEDLKRAVEYGKPGTILEQLGKCAG
jgi:hypothetical protein